MADLRNGGPPEWRTQIIRDMLSPESDWKHNVK